MKSGLIAVNKPDGISSARVVSRVKRVLGAKKVGHTGTLDPFATGLLLCAVNQGTKISKFFLGGDKRYTARVHLGIETDTYDRIGQTVATVSQATIDNLDTENIKAVVASFCGVQNQVPPVYSALKHNGQPLYKLARQGTPVEKPARQIEIFDITIEQIDLPHMDINVFCSTGTYIRSLAYDIGKKLGCGAHLSELCRTQSSAFMLKDAISLDALETLNRAEVEQRIIGLSDCLDFLPKIIADKFLARKIGYGQKIEKKEIDQIFQPSAPVRVVDENNDLLAVIQLAEDLQTYNYSCVFSS